MPRGDGTGPAGMGPLTGRAAGYCAGYDRPGFMNPGFGGGGWGRGGGRGWRNWYRATGMPGWQRAGMGYPAWGPTPYGAPAPPSREQEAEYLRSQAEQLSASLEDIRARLDELEKSEGE